MASLLAWCARNEQPFSDRSLQGAYGFSSSGTLFGAPEIAVGRTVFDGEGTYAVQPDGTGTLTVALPVLGTFNIAFVIVDNKRALHTISLDPEVSTTALLKKQ